METKKLFVARRIDEKGIDELKKHSNIEISINEKDEVLSTEELIERAAGSDAIITLLTDKITGQTMDKIGPQLKIIANYAVGFDNIEIEEAKKRNIIVTNTPEVMTQAVAEHAVALMLACARRISEGDNFIREKKYKQWEPELLLGPEIAGKTLGIVGIGRIGSALAQIAYHGFGMKIIYHDIQHCDEIERNLQAEFASLHSVLEKSDFISLHVPLLDSTHHMIGSEELKLMKKSAILVNTARGAIIDEKALIVALQDKEIFAAGLDVFENEIPSVELLTIDNVVMTPHIASATHEARISMSECVAENVIEVLSGRPAKCPCWK